MSVPASRAQLDQSDLEELIQIVLDEAGKQGADQAEVAASHDYGLGATARLGDVEHLEYTNDRGIGVTVYHGSRKGSASTSDFSIDALRETVTKASAFAKYTAVDKYAGLADAELMASDIPDLELCHHWPIDADAAIKTLKAGKHVLCEKPLAMEPGDCQRMVKVASQTGRLLSVGHVLPFFPEYVWARKMIGSGKYGKLLGGSFRRTPTWPNDTAQFGVYHVRGPWYPIQR